jgi:hypothetical protein
MAQVFTVSLFEFGPEQNGVRFNYITRVQGARTSRVLRIAFAIRTLPPGASEPFSETAKA